MMRQVEIKQRGGMHTVVIGDSPTRYFSTFAEAEAFVDGLRYEGYPRSDLDFGFCETSDK